MGCVEFQNKFRLCDCHSSKCEPLMNRFGGLVLTLLLKIVR